MKSLAEAYPERGQYRVAADKLVHELQLNNLWSTHTIAALAQAFSRSASRSQVRR
jgi:hypothetical protein